MEEKKIHLYHRIMRRENFENAANDIFNLILGAQKSSPDEPRILSVDIDGHRNEEGGFDEDMFELQIEFGMKVLLKFVTELHFPLYSHKNPSKQINELPSELHIYNSQDKKDEQLDDLYIENYSNTEFISESDVYSYLLKFSNFIKEYNDLDVQYAMEPNKKYDDLGLLSQWRIYMKNLINELFNSFVHGNLLTATAMTRALIESYVYLKILITEEDPTLLKKWHLCSIVSKTKAYDDKTKRKIFKIVEKYCQEIDMNYDEVITMYSKGNENTWLSFLIGKKRVTFRDVCEYLDEQYLYDDFQQASSFIHGQDVLTKMQPFLFYESIFNKFYIMITYIIKAIALYPLEENILTKLEQLEYELKILSENYIDFER